MITFQRKVATSMAWRLPFLRTNSGENAMTRNISPGNRVGSIGLGLTFAGITTIGFLSFIVVGAFWPHVLQEPISTTSVVTTAYLAGLGLIAGGMLLTIAYVWQANAAARTIRIARGYVSLSKVKHRPST